MEEIIAFLSSWSGVMRMLLFEKLTTFRSKIASALLIISMLCGTLWLVNWLLLSIKTGWF